MAHFAAFMIHFAAFWIHFAALQLAFRCHIQTITAANASFPAVGTTVSCRRNSSFPPWELQFPIGGTPVSCLGNANSQPRNGSYLAVNQLSISMISKVNAKLLIFTSSGNYHFVVLQILYPQHICNGYLQHYNPLFDK